MTGNAKRRTEARAQREKLMVRSMFDQAEALLLDQERPTSWWWLSYADPTKPPGEQFVGCAVVDAPRVDGDDRLQVTAVLMRATALDCNPGAEVEVSGPIPRHELDEHCPWTHRRRLLTTAEELARVGVDPDQLPGSAL